MAHNPKWERNARVCWGKRSKAQKRRDRWFWRHPDKWTDYPIRELGDTPNQIAPIRKVDWVGPGEKWVMIRVHGVEAETKRGYLYGTPRRLI